MRNCNFLLIITISFIALFSSCAKEGPMGPTGPAGPAYTGNISGHVSLFDQYGSRILTGLDSVKLTIATTSTSTAITPVSPDNSGYFNYASLATGEYNINASATGYGSTNTNSFQFLGGTLNHDIKLSAIPDYSVTAAAGSGAVYDTVTVYCTADPQVRTFLIFVGNSSSVSNATSTYMLSYAKNIPVNGIKVTNLISAQELYNAGFASGDPVYFAVYSGVVADASVYEDQSSGKNVYNAVSNPQFVSALVP